MTALNYTYKKNLSYKIEGQKHPFIDKNLQIQLPILDEQLLNHTPFCSSQLIYSHNLQEYKQLSSSNTIKLEQEMKEAEKSHLAWRKLHAKIAVSYFTIQSNK